MKTKNRIALSSFSLIVVMAFLLIAVSACQKDENETDLKPAPDLPPQSSMVMDFSDFTDIDTTAYKNTETFQNWGWSALNVTVWNAVITITLVVPVAAFYESFNHEGVYDPETDEWVWSYNFFAGGVIHQASLHASLVAEGIHWEMYITKNNAYNDFLWYQGTTNPANSTATWHFNEKPANPNELLLIEYQKDTQTSIEQIKYTNVDSTSPGNGGYIQYGTDTTLDFDAFYNIYLIEEENMTNIEWNRTMKDGRVRDEHHFGDFEWRCWDTDLQDIICP
ncbi:MAG: hypothetical protein K8S16_16230 [Bacteroidales bacterium]|nr:hypothetical protein [Bacteroidales bacterium]